MYNRLCYCKAVFKVFNDQSTPITHLMLFALPMNLPQHNGKICIEAVQHCYPASTTVSVLRSVSGTALTHCLSGNSGFDCVLPCMLCMATHMPCYAWQHICLLATHCYKS